MKNEIKTVSLSTVFLLVCVVLLLINFLHNAFIKPSNEAKRFKQCVKDGYVVYIDGNLVQHPDKMVSSGYTYEFNDKKKEVYIK